MDKLVLKTRHDYTMREKCPNSEFSWAVFSCIWAEDGEIRSISPYSVQTREKIDKKNSEYGHFSRGNSN